MGSLLGVSPSIVVHKVSATVALHDATITATSSSGSGVEISATTNVDASGQAYVSGLRNDTSKFAVAFSIGYVRSDARTLLTGSTAVSSQAEASVTSSATATVKASARASVNLLGSINATNYAFALGVAVNELSSLTQLGENATIMAGAAVAVTSSGSEKTGASVSTQANIDGNLGLTIGVGVSNSTVRTVVDGDISAGAAPATQGSFDAAAAVTPSSAAAGSSPPAQQHNDPRSRFLYRARR